MLKNSCFFFVAFAGVLTLLAIIGLRHADVKESYESIGSKKKDDKIKWSDMWHVLRDNRPAQMYIVSCATDKLAADRRKPVCYSYLVKWYSDRQLQDNDHDQ